MDLGKEVDQLKLKDFKCEPEKYESMKTMCKEMGIDANDQTDISEILEKSNAIKTIVDVANAKLSRR